MKIGKVNSTALIIGQAVTAGQFVNIYVDGNVSKIRPADSSLNYLADGFVLESGAINAVVNVFLLGINDAVSNVPIGPVFLFTNGGVSASPPSPGSNVLLQLLGKAISSKAIVFERGLVVLRTV